jgi:hypothetical protein
LLSSNFPKDEFGELFGHLPQGVASEVVRIGLPGCLPRDGFVHLGTRLRFQFFPMPNLAVLSDVTSVPIADTVSRDSRIFGDNVAAHVTHLATD